MLSRMLEGISVPEFPTHETGETDKKPKRLIRDDLIPASFLS